MKYSDLCHPVLPELKGIGDEPNTEIFEAQRRDPVRVSKHRVFKRDEHDRFMPMHYNGINMPVNIKD